MPFRDIQLYARSPLSPDQVAQLQSLALRIVARLPNHGYRLRGQTTASLGELQTLSFVDTVAVFDPEQKLDANLRANAAMAAAAITAAGAELVAQPPVNVLVTLDRQADTQATVAALRGLGNVVSEHGRRAVVRVSADRLSALAALDGVLSAEVEPEVTTQNNVARTLTNAQPLVQTLGLNGAGETVGVADSGLDTGVIPTVLPDFLGRVVNIRATVNKAAFGVANGADLNNHGTHVCGSILGDGTNSNGTLAGLAPSAQLTVLSMGPNSSGSLSVPADLTTGVFQDAYGDGARIHSNSWNSNNQGGLYTGFSSDVDEFVWDNRDLLVVIAAGNAGPGASTVGPPGTAKNCLTVGASESVRPLPASITLDPNLQDHDFNPATLPQNVPLALNNFGTQADNADDIASFSGRGPTNDTGDSRIKPDIVAPGTFILSCRSSVSIADVGPDGLPHVGNIAGFYANDADGVFSHAEAVGSGLPGAPFFGTWNQNTPAVPPGSGAVAQQNYFYSSGTSMATPITSGAVALLRQYLRQRRGIANPSAALMKALIVNGATVPAADSNTPNNTRGFGWLNLEKTLMPAPTGQQAYADDPALAVATGDVRHFTIQLADPAQPLRVTLTWSDSPGKGLQNRLYLRLVPPGGGAAIDGDLTAFPNPSNNVQRIHVAAPAAGTWTIEVHGVDVTFGVTGLPGTRQDFALAVINGIGFSPKPVDVVQVIDHSGSMGFYSFMTPAKERAKQLVDVLRIDDRTGVVQFDGTADTVHAVTAIAGLPTLTAIKTAIDTIVADDVTSIGAGLLRGKDDLALGGDPAHPQALVLISDGHENTPPWVGGGLANSPPAWYGGPDFSEALPTVPATTKIYTVSLGPASDEVLLQAIAMARGGTFNAIHSPSDIGKLHEIYVHLQALVGGEEVIAAGTNSVQGVTISGDGPVISAAPPSLPELANLVLLARLPGGRPSSKNIHVVPVDDTVESAVFMVSWHDIRRPVTLKLVTPSLQVILPNTVLHRVVTGSSYQLYRVEHPEPGRWELHVSPAPGHHDNVAPNRTYTWGVHGETPVGLRLKPPARPLGLRRIELAWELADPDRRVKVSRPSGRFSALAVPVADLLMKHAAALRRIDLPFKPDTPAVDPNLYKLGLLELRLVTDGKPSLFRLRTGRLPLTPGKASAPAPNPGVVGIALATSGRTQRGFPFLRQVRLDVRV